MSEPTFTIAEIALAVVACPRCGAAVKESCAAAMRRKLDPAISPDACRELEDIARGAPQLAHPERLKEARALVESAVAYGLVAMVRC